MASAPKANPPVQGALSVPRTALLSLADLGRTVTTLLSDRLGMPTALLSRTDGVWKFEAEAWPESVGGAGAKAPWGYTSDPILAPATSATNEAGDGAGSGWTGITVGGAEKSRSWMLLLPGGPDAWEGTPVVSQLVPDIGDLLEDAAERELRDAWKRNVQRYHRFCRRLARARSADDLHGVIVRGLSSRVRAEVAALALFSEAEHRLSIVKTLGYPQELVDHLRIAPGDGVIGAVFQSARAVLMAANCDDQPRRLRYRTDSFLAVPLMGASSVLGVVTLTDRRDGGPFTHDDLAAVRLLAGPAALALTSQKLRQSSEEVTRLASIDPLTSLFNRRYFDTRLEAELQRARRHGDPLTLLMVDIDNFKAINDEHGHMVGDQLLRSVADRLRRGVRIFDVCARYGGDEFAILMPSSNVDTAILVAERIRASVRGHCVYDSASVTVSIGVAHSDGRERELLSIADRALLEAKAMGKNTVRVQRRLN
jgi:diguanylate cyclase (GGDEF)-like protein